MSLSASKEDLRRNKEEIRSRRRMKLEKVQCVRLSLSNAEWANEHEAAMNGDQHNTDDDNVGTCQVVGLFIWTGVLLSVAAGQLRSHFRSNRQMDIVLLSVFVIKQMDPSDRRCGVHVVVGAEDSGIGMEVVEEPEFILNLQNV
ncbi:hypothetical protein BLNAU_16919 [Blattamonas nauphoetae]|uniref:Uncharacterized protein n=1 Tax=Blattamonas nauphoetae TaxID=2049346 RepID=A0ABQ9X9N8_9EUKA|nr:hypothetical protein BLNAU_16919 [Blattamonas nauphoetae]